MLYHVISPELIAFLYVVLILHALLSYAQNQGATIIIAIQ